ncbi:MAG: GNAT family N-acetyltransferase [Betaproteobacteria bacterium HGW-Betaproteobacteria-3]|jgi:putative acetyltransferase|nr:MAG: GNAT family N-acetyltransferase [Betaproteobacteria bacterium HGW-Betaproteobacteria-3]
MVPALQIRLDDLSDPRLADFLAEHLQDMRATSPPESVHALDLGQLRHPSVRFWSVWRATEAGETLVGTGALKRLDDQHAELKSMRTAARFRGQGVATQLLQHLLDQAHAMGFTRLSLETGSQPFFEPAYRLYLAHGFAPCAPFGSYGLDPNSRYLTRAL